MIKPKVFGALATVVAIVGFMYFLGAYFLWWVPRISVDNYLWGFCFGFLAYATMAHFTEKIKTDKDIMEMNKRYNQRMIKRNKRELERLKKGRRLI